MDITCVVIYYISLSQLWRVKSNEILIRWHFYSIWSRIESGFTHLQNKCLIHLHEWFSIHLVWHSYSPNKHVYDREETLFSTRYCGTIISKSTVFGFGQSSDVSSKRRKFSPKKSSARSIFSVNVIDAHKKRKFVSTSQTATQPVLLLWFRPAPRKNWITSSYEHIRWSHKVVQSNVHCVWHYRAWLDWMELF